ncbi:unnamed protein product [Rotaria sp. Silwood2]|nr:unnamed protein product [Rotaria sp. Silwood2]CAF3196099.1 unnamed protein product [Rotaria sp. Silwood2]CAF4056638.1 unnamed protein product [Rotaria sp. Silwood2]
MAHILIDWLNDDVQLSKKIESSNNLSSEFATGYLFGEILSKYGLQEDFPQFSTSKNSVSQLNNFTRIERTLHLLEIPFNTNSARQIMTMEKGAVQQLLYQLYTALNRKKRRNLTGAAMETMKAPATKILAQAETQQYQNLIKKKTTRQCDLSLQQLVAKHEEFKARQDEIINKQKYEDDEEKRQDLESKRQYLLNRSKEKRAKDAEMMTKIKSQQQDLGYELEIEPMPASVVMIPKTPPLLSKQALEKKRRLKKEVEMQDTMNDIRRFEKRVLQHTEFDDDEGFDENTQGESMNLADMELSSPYEQENKDQTSKICTTTSYELVTYTKPLQPGQVDPYILEIRRRLQEDIHARREREKRRRKVLVDQLRALEAIEDSKREESLVSHLLRQSQFERRLAVELLQTRHEKDILRQNRIAYEKQLEVRRKQDFIEAMDREAELARLARLEYAEQVRKDKELHDILQAEKAEAKHKEHVEFCTRITWQLVDFALKIGEYRQLTENLIPAKVWREWNALFVGDRPFFDDEQRISEAQQDEIDRQEQKLHAQTVLQEESLKILDEGDFNEYRNMIGDWEPPAGSQSATAITHVPPIDNPIFGYVVNRLHNIVHPPADKIPPPLFPAFGLKIIVLGKSFAGKSTAIKRYGEETGVTILNIEQLLHEAIEAFNNSEIRDDETDDTDMEYSTKMDHDNVPISHGNPSIDQTGNFYLQYIVHIKKKTNLDKNLKYYINIENEDIFDIFKKTEDNRNFSLCLQTFTTNYHTFNMNNNAKKRQKKKKIHKNKKKTKLKQSPTLYNIPSNTSISGLFYFQLYTTGGEYPPGPPPTLDDLTDAMNSEQLNNKKNRMDKLTDRAKLGSIIVQSMKLGESLSDRMAVQLIAERLRRIPDREGWIIDGFPTTYEQVKLLENVLSGYEEERPKEFDPLLAPNPRPTPPPEPYKSIIDLVVLFHVTNDIIIRRAAGRSFAPLANREFHEQYNSPPIGAATGFNGQEQVFPTKDAANDMEQLQHRISQFQDSYPRIEKFYSQYSKVVVVDEIKSDTPLDEEQLYHELSRAIETHVDEEQAKIRQAEEERQRAENERLAKEQEELEAKRRAEEEAAKAQEAAEAAAAAERAAKEAAEAEAAAKKGGKGGKKDRSPAASAVKKGSPKPAGKKGKKEEEPIPTVGTVPSEPQGPPPPKPGSEEWVYVQEPIDPEITIILSTYYDAVESNYIDACKIVFRNIRFERSHLVDHFYNAKVNFKIFLDRPDAKQEYVDIFVKEFNALPDDARDDEEFKQELHQRVEDLSDTLHEIASQRKEESEKEREIVMTDGWVSDHLGLLTNHYITLMQSEIDRYQDALRMLRDYYKSMQQPIPDEMKQDYARLPLFELMEGGERPASVAESLVDYDSTKPPGSATGNIDLEASSQVGTPKKGKRASSASKNSKRTPSPPKSPKGGRKPAGKKDKEAQQSIDATTQSPGQDPSMKNIKPKLPMVPRRPLSAFDTTDNKKRAAQAAAAKKRADDPNAGEPSPPPPEDMDERLIFDGHRLATQYVNDMLTSEQANAEIDTTANAAAAGGAAAPAGAGGKDAKGGGKDVKGDKKGAGGKDSAGKGGKKGGKKADEQPVESLVEVTPEELAKRELRTKMKEEYLAALSNEVRICQARLMLIRDVGSRAITSLKTKADETYTRMYEWLGEKYKQETESIENMSKIIRYAIESKEKIEQQLVLDRYAFYIAEDVIVAPPPVLPPRPLPLEQTTSELFTVDQLRELFKQFILTAPSGLLSTKTFIDLYSDLTTVTVGQRLLPEAWSNLDQIQIESLATMLSNGSEFINWRLWLLFASQPWPHPTQQELLNLLFTYAEHDTDHSGFISRTTFNEIPLWFIMERASTPEDPSLPRPYNREHHLKQFWFDLFALDDNASLLPYEDMLLYMAAVPNPLHGFCRALTIAEQTVMPTLKEQLPQIDMHCAILNTQEYERLTEREREQIQEGEIETPNDGFISVDGLHHVLHHGERKFGDTHRFATTEDPEDFASKERLYAVWDEMQIDRSSKIHLSALLNHPVIADMVANCCKYRAPDFKQILHIKQIDEMSAIDSHGHRTPEQTILS